MPLPVSPAGRKYGHTPASVSPNDSLYSNTHAMFSLSALPAKVDLSPWLSPVKDQKSLGSCTAFSGTTQREYLSKRFLGSYTTLSPLFLYFVERTIDGDVSQDAGSSLRTSQCAMHNVGICPETEDPYVIANFTKIPTQQDYKDAARFVSGTYHRLMNLTDMKNTLNDGFVFQLGFNVYSSFESAETAATGIMTMPNLATEQNLGGHAVCAFGFNDDFVFPGTTMTGALLIRNSWGPNWGVNGNFYMPYAYISQYVSECWMCHLPALVK
jgi:C1A family cysteine protease